MGRPKLAGQQPWSPPPRRPPKPKGPKAPGTFSNPFQRSDGVSTVKIAFRASLECVSQLEQLAASLKMEGITRNVWLEELVLHGIEHGFRPPKRKEPKPEEDVREAG